MDVPIAKAAEAFKGIVKLFAEAEVISTSFPPSVKSKVYDALDVVVATVIVGEVKVLFVRVWVEVVPTTLPDTPWTLVDKLACVTMSAAISVRCPSIPPGAPVPL
jgi:hypothetical protein